MNYGFMRMLCASLSVRTEWDLYIMAIFILFG